MANCHSVRKMIGCGSQVHVVVCCERYEVHGWVEAPALCRPVLFRKELLVRQLEDP